jgi:DNA-binding MarR family transcriptional regulator
VGTVVRPASRHAADPADVHQLVTAVLTASRVLVSVSARSLAGVEDVVTVTQFRTLVVMEAHGELNLNGLAALLDVTPSTALRMIDRLLVADLVTRRDNPDNRREVLLGLTKQGRAIVAKVTRKRRAEIPKIVAARPNARRSELVAALKAFADAAGELDAPEPESTHSLGW